ncbi:MAG: molybdate transport system permease protein [Phycisphaerales bacterium]|jgi:molybdate transport system permease protein
MLDLESIAISLRLGLAVSVTVALVGPPLASWLASRRSWLGQLGQGLTLLPLALPPTVLGLLLVSVMRPDGPLGQALTTLGLATPLFTFTGLWIASCIASLPIAIQPMLVAFGSIDREVIAAAEVCGATRIERFCRITFPIALPGILTGAALAFAHSVGQFGVVLMVGGSIPGQTRTASIAIYDDVQLGDFDAAWTTSLALIAMSAVVVLAALVGGGLLGSRSHPS